MQKIRWIVLVFILAACSPAPTPTPTITSTPPPTLTATATFTATHSPTPTLTPTPDPLAGLPEAVRAQIEAGNIYNAEKGYVANPDGRVMSLLLPSGEWKTEYNGNMPYDINALEYNGPRPEVLGDYPNISFYAEAGGMMDYLKSPESDMQWNDLDTLRYEQVEEWWVSRVENAILGSLDMTWVDNKGLGVFVGFKDGQVVVVTEGMQYNHPILLEYKKKGYDFFLISLFDFQHPDGYQVTRVGWPSATPGERNARAALVWGNEAEVLEQIRAWAEGGIE